MGPKRGGPKKGRICFMCEWAVVLSVAYENEFSLFLELSYNDPTAEK